MDIDLETIARIQATIDQIEENQKWFLGLTRPTNHLVWPPAPEHYDYENDYQDENTEIEEFLGV